MNEAKKRRSHSRSSRSSAARWPALILIPALLIAAAMGGSSDGPATDADESIQPQALGPVVAGPGSLGAFWFCSGGTGMPGGVADHQVVAINTTDTPRLVSMTVYGSRMGEGERPEPVVAPQFALAPFSRIQVRLGDYLAAEYVSATVELDGGGVTVEHIVQGPNGVDAGPCSSTSSPDWSVPIGGTDTTAANAVRRELLVFFNPFPADAVLDVRFSTDSGDRGVPKVFNGFVVPGHGVVGVDLSVADVVLSSEVSAEVTARIGRVVVDRVQIYAEPERAGVALSSGVPSAAGGWVFPAGGISATRHETLVIANPGDVPSEVDVEIRPEDSEFSPEPFELSVPPHRHVVLDLNAEERMAELLAENALFSIIVRTADGTAVAAERLSWVAAGQPGAGVSTSVGTALMGNRLVADFAGAQPNSLLTVFNPSNQTVVQVKVSVLADGAMKAPLGSAEIAIQPGRRVTIPVESLASGNFTVVLDASSPIMAERDIILASDRYLAMAVPDASSLQVADLSLFGE